MVKVGWPFGAEENPAPLNGNHPLNTIVRTCHTMLANIADGVEVLAPTSPQRPSVIFKRPTCGFSKQTVL
ncbi:hypothetical protein ACFQ14_14155 [Pseudahrensia aquimaris]|uniref:Uncharacterized protein n=1 Tax=Pseudahrensia aquimaris TaxID=744461 RepID=A0ABW3FJX3_9HYPH